MPMATPGHVLCCLCGDSILPNPSNMCLNCIRSQVDVTEGAWGGGEGRVSGRAGRPPNPSVTKFSQAPSPRGCTVLTQLNINGPAPACYREGTLPYCRELLTGTGHSLQRLPALMGAAVSCSERGPKRRPRPWTTDFSPLHRGPTPPSHAHTHPLTHIDTLFLPPGRPRPP